MIRPIASSLPLISIAIANWPCMFAMRLSSIEPPRANTNSETSSTSPGRSSPIAVSTVRPSTAQRYRTPRAADYRCGRRAPRGAKSNHPGGTESHEKAHALGDTGSGTDRGGGRARTGLDRRPRSRRGSGRHFVIGDTTLTRSNDVYFWGSQWWKNNEVSSDDTHPSFKGYAVSVDSNACTFTSRPGNSAPPPDGPLGDTITVIVTSKVVKSGPTLSGTVVAFAQVAVDPGYDDNPGHEGTGTVVSYTPCFVGGAGGPGEL